MKRPFSIDHHTKQRIRDTAVGFTIDEITPTTNDLTDEQAKAVKFGGGTTLYYFKEMGQPTVAQWLEKTRKPMLILQGEKDVQAKAKVDFAGYKQILGDRENVSFRLYPNLNHCFVPARSHSIADAKKEFTPERHIGKDVLDDIARWIMEQS